MGLKILPPDINRSEIKYTGKEREIWVGFMQLKELSQEAKEATIHERSKNGPFISFEDFLDRTESHLQDIRILIKAGSFDSIARDTTRPSLMWQALRFFAQKEEDKIPGLFSTHLPPSPKKSPYPRKLMLEHEVKAFGFILSAHPLDLYREILEGLDYVRARDLRAHVGKRVETPQLTGLWVLGTGCWGMGVR
jgi:DNA polymerase III alpha subunit